MLACCLQFLALRCVSHIAAVGCLSLDLLHIQSDFHHSVGCVENFLCWFLDYFFHLLFLEVYWLFLCSFPLLYPLPMWLKTAILSALVAVFFSYIFCFVGMHSKDDQFVGICGSERQCFHNQVVVPIAFHYGVRECDLVNLDWDQHPHRS